MNVSYCNDVTPFIDKNKKEELRQRIKRANEILVW